MKTKVCFSIHTQSTLDIASIITIKVNKYIYKIELIDQIKKLKHDVPFHVFQTHTHTIVLYSLTIQIV